MELECNAAKEKTWLREVESIVCRKNRTIVGLREVEERGEMGEFRTTAPKICIIIDTDFSF